MKNASLTFVLFLVCALLAGCEPQNSVYPLYAASDDAFEPLMLGEWLLQSGPEVKAAEKSDKAIFRKGKAPDTYEITIPDIDEKDMLLLSEAKLVKLGDFLFIDFGSPDLESSRNSATLPYPGLRSHVFGRVYSERDKMRIDFLSDTWVSDQAKAGKLTLASIETPEGSVLAAKTDELRKFALEYAEDKEAFSESFAFQRKK